MLAPGTLLASRYRVLSELGRGGMGAVFLVEHVHTGDRAALKLLHESAAFNPESLERFKREARAPARIQSENVVRVLDADTAPELGGAAFLVMELLTGSDLQRLVTARGPLPPAEVARLLGQAARALDKAHAIGIVHRDLKPENLFLHQREDGTSVLKILDFGISKSVHDARLTGAGHALTQTGTVMGTPLYMSLEQALARHDLVGPGADLWALGLIAIFLLTGEPYWQGSTVPDVLGKVLAYAVYRPTARWPGLPPAIDGWFLRSCARRPEERFRTAGEQAAALAEAFHAADAAALAHAPTMLGAASPSSPPPTPGRTPANAASYSTPPPTPYPATPYVGSSTNEPLLRTAPHAHHGARGAWALALSVALLGLSMLVGGLFVLSTKRAPTREAPPRPTTAVTPPPVAPATATTTAQGPALEPLAPASAAPTARAAPPPATARPAAPRSRAECRVQCLGSCKDASDVQGCLVRCLRKCPPS